ncbi:DDE-type integrase/transposase/recombinase [Nonomuraea sp. B19D2]|uniref:DDE-type integrase/transposase/recombinase n=1 Tax=Nonomuraea sp. B19D2 TaxID=3159561 RepID=UPI0032DB8F55
MQDEANNTALVDLVEQNLAPDRPNELCFTDITYIRTWTGWVYLASIIDGCTRKMVDCSVADHVRAETVTDALKMAIECQRPKVGQTIIHSAPGPQGSTPVARSGISPWRIESLPPAGHAGICFDNAVSESFNGTIGKELIYLHTWPTLERVQREVFKYIEIYHNRKFLHPGIENSAPSQF